MRLTNNQTIVSIFMMIIGCSYSYSSFAQEDIPLFSLSGEVTDQQGASVPFAYVSIDSLKVGITADEKGRYRLKNIPFGRHKITARSAGFKSQTEVVTLKNQSKRNVDFSLEEEAQALEEVTIIGESKSESLRVSAKAVSVLETREVKLQAADLGDVLTQVAGVNVRKSGGLGSSNRLSLNGLTDDQIRFMVDGIPLDLMGYSNGIANVPVNLTERVEVYKGVVPIALGADALGGAVNLTTPKELSSNAGNVSYQIGSFGTHRIAANGELNFKGSGLFISGSGYYDYTKNDYKIEVEEQLPENPRGRLSPVTVRRFHDTYGAYGMRATLGIRNKSWTEELSFEVFTNQYDQDIQNNLVMAIPYGEIVEGATNYGALLRYQHKVLQKLEIDLAAGYYDNEFYAVDTSRFIYNWFGERVTDENGDVLFRQPGEVEATDRLLWDKVSYARTNLSYQINDRHSIGYALAPTHSRRTGDERWLEEQIPIDPLNDKNTIFNLTQGLDYSWKSQNGKWGNTFFLKDYRQTLKIEEALRDQEESRKVSYQGLGNYARLKLNDRWLLKLSYERSIRLPRITEVFATSVLDQNNLDLLPERSHNVNMEANYRNKVESATDWGINLTVFGRSIDNLIVFFANDITGGYQNVDQVQSKGMELSAFWESPNNQLRLDGNTTWLDFRNTSNEGRYAGFEGDRIPNRPYYFVNGSSKYSFTDIRKPNDKLSFFYNMQYVHEFFRGWESAGSNSILAGSKDIIPSQLIQNVGLTYESLLKSVKLSYTFQIQNLMNDRNFDFFGVQKPGRAFYFKLTTQF